MFRLGVAALLLAMGLVLPQGAHAIPPEAQYVGEKTCIKCHDVEAKHFGDTTHAKVFRQNPRNALEARVCEACHGPGSQHARDGSYRATAIQSCVKCHTSNDDPDFDFATDWPKIAH